MGVRHLANTLEPSMCGGDAACCKITLTTYYLNSFHIVCLHADCEDIKGGLVQTHFVDIYCTLNQVIPQ